MTTHLDSPKDQSLSTLADEFERLSFMWHETNWAADRTAIARLAIDHMGAILTALRSPTREAARSEALREAATIARSMNKWGAGNGTDIASAILALQDRATSGTTGRPDPGQGELNYYRAEGTGDTICIRCEFNLSTYLRERIDAAVRAERERGDGPRHEPAEASPGTDTRARHR